VDPHALEREIARRIERPLFWLLAVWILGKKIPPEITSAECSNFLKQKFENSH